MSANDVPIGGLVPRLPDLSVCSAKTAGLEARSAAERPCDLEAGSFA
jgi:hypothetical protein